MEIGQVFIKKQKRSQLLFFALQVASCPNQNTQNNRTQWFILKTSLHGWEAFKAIATIGNQAEFYSMLKRVRECIRLRSRGRKVELLYGVFNGLEFESPRLQKWNRKKEMIKYIAKQGRQMLKAGGKLICDVLDMWRQ